MMEFYIHGRLNKTGNSCPLLLEKNVELLRAYGISYVYRQAGFGNAAQFLFNLRNGYLKRLRARLAKYREIAGSTRVLSSCERLYHGIVQTAHREIADANFSTPQLQFFFREPEAHALSYFYYRCGVRDIGVSEDWLQHCYELRAFFAALGARLGMELTVKPYSFNLSLAEMANWLGPPTLLHSVNEQNNCFINAHKPRLVTWKQQGDAPATVRLRKALKELDALVRHKTGCFGRTRTDRRAKDLPQSKRSLITLENCLEHSFPLSSLTLSRPK